MRKTCNILILSLLLAILFLSLSACNKTVVTGIEVVEGSLKTIYSLDEQLDLSEAKLRVSYSGKDSVIVPLTSAMLLNEFNSAMPGERELNIKYMGKSLSFKYEVKSDIEIDSPFRLILNPSKTQPSVSIAAKNTSLVSLGVFALSFDLTLTGVNLVSLTRFVSDDYELVYTTSANVVKVVIYSKSGFTPLTADGTLATLSFSKIITENVFSLSVSNIRISDGQTDYTKMPTTEVGL